MLAQNHNYLNKFSKTDDINSPFFDSRYIYGQGHTVLNSEDSIVFYKSGQILVKFSPNCRPAPLALYSNYTHVQKSYCQTDFKFYS